MASTVVGTLRILLEANASKLESEFAKATIKISDFDKFTQNAGRSLQRMTEQFSGQRIVAEAAKMAAAIEKVGGVSSLTDRELSRVSTTIGEATAKLRAMGAEVPPSIAKLHAEIGALGTKSQATTGFLGGMGGILGKLGPLLPIASVAGLGTALIRMGKSAFDSASQIVDLSNKTGLSTEAVQRMQHVANQTGSDIQAFSNAAFKLGVNVAEGTTKARDAVNALGLSYAELKRMKPEDQFAAVIKALEGVDNQQERNRLGVALFGKQFSEIAASVQEGYSKIADAAQITADAQLQALDAAGDAWTKFVDGVGREVQRYLGTVVLLSQGKSGGSLLQLTPGELIDKKAFMDAGGTLEAFIVLVRKARESQNDIVLSTDSGTAAFVDYIAALQSAQKEVAGLSGVQKSQLNAALKIGGDSAKEYAESIGLSETALRLYSATANKAATSSARLAKDLGIIEGNLTDQLKLIIDYNVGWTDFHTNAPRIAGDMNELNALIMAQAVALKDLTATINLGILATTQYTAAWAPYKTVLEQTLPKVEDHIGKTKRLADGQRVLSDGLRNLSQAFAQLAQIAGGSLGSVLQSIGNLVGGMNLAHTAGKNIRDGMIEIDAAGGGAAEKFTLITANIGAYTAAMAQAVNTTSRFQAALGGFSATSSFASGLGWSGGASAAAGLIGGVIGIAFAMEKARAEKARYREALFKVKKEFLEVFRETHLLRQAFPALSAEFANLFSVPLNENVLERMGEIVAEIGEKVAATNDEFAGLAQRMVDAGFKIPSALQPVLQQLVTLGVLSKENASIFAQLTDGTVVDWRKMEEAAGRYGDWLKTQLGPAFDQLKISDRAKQIVNDFDLMKRGGAEVGSILMGMQDELVALIQDAIRTGAKLPENMRPWIDELERAGLLVDENGEKLWDLGALQFAPPIKTEFEILTEALQAFIDKLDLVIDKFGELAQVKLPGLPVPAGSSPDGGGNTTNPGGPIPFAAGGLVTRPTFAWLGEAGPELVMPLRSAFGSIASGIFSGLRDSLRVPMPAIPDFAFDGPGMPIGRVDDGGGDRNQTRPGDVILMPVLIPNSDNEDDLRDTVSAKWPVDLAGDRNGLRTRAIPILAREVARILRGGR